MKASRKDVALKAGVSEATVSYVLNKSRYVSEETINKVYEAVKDLDYYPDMVARSMVKNQTNQLAIFMGDLDNPYYGEIVLGFENASFENNYFTSISSSDINVERYISNFIARRIDGVFILAMPLEFHFNSINRLLKNEIKVLISGGFVEEFKGKVSYIEVLYSKGIDDAILYLKELGHKNIAMLSGIERNFKFDNRVDCFANSMKKHLPNSEVIIIEGQKEYKSDMDLGYKLMENIIKNHSEVTAVICRNDIKALGAMLAANDYGKSVPEDISIIGIDDILFASLSNPTLTSIGVDKRAYGRLAFEILENAIENKVFEHKTIDTFLIKRNSTASPNK